MLAELLVNGLVVGTKLGLAGLGFAIIFYTTRELHFAYGVLLTLSGYISYLLIAQWGLSAWVGVPIALILSSLLGMAVQYWLYRPLADHLSVLLISLGLSIVGENALQIIFGVHDKIIPSGYFGRLLIFGDIRLRLIDLVVLGCFLLVWACLYYLLHWHRYGLALRAVMRDPVMSELVGIKSRYIKLFAYALGTAIAAISGLLTVADSGLRPSVGFELLLFAFIFTLLGAGSLHRVALWSLIIGVMMNLSSWKLPSQFQTLIVFGFMLVYMLVRERMSSIRQL